jgi:hypothetical protein
MDWTLWRRELSPSLSAVEPCCPAINHMALKFHTNNVSYSESLHLKTHHPTLLSVIALASKVSNFEEAFSDSLCIYCFLNWNMLFMGTFILRQILCEISSLSPSDGLSRETQSFLILDTVVTFIPIRRVIIFLNVSSQFEFWIKA